MKTSRMLLAALAVTTSALPALAGGPMPQGTFTIGAERLMGIAHADVKDTPPAPLQQTDFGATSITFLGNGGFNAGVGVGNGRDTFGDPRAIYVNPRVGLDYFIIDGLSLGGSFTLLHTSVSPSQPAGPGFSETDWLFAPRVGYAYMFSDVVGIWPRGGISYSHDSQDYDDPTQNGSSGHVFALDLDVPFLIAPVKDFAITVGPVFDVTLGGSQGLNYRRGDVPPPDIGVSMTLFGLYAGVVGIL